MAVPCIRLEAPRGPRSPEEEGIMRFVAISLPAIPASPEERQKLRPIGHRTDKWQQMIEENVALAQMLDDLCR